MKSIDSTFERENFYWNTLHLFPDEVYVRNRGPLLPVAVDRIHLRGLRGRLQGEYRSLCVVSFNIIIVSSTRTHLSREQRTTVGGEGWNRSRNFPPQHNPSLPENAQYFPETKLQFDLVAPFEILFSASSPFFLLAEHRRVIDEEGAERGTERQTRNYQEQMLEGVKKEKEKKEEKEKRGVDLFREIRATTTVIPCFFRLIQHSVAPLLREEEKRERERWEWQEKVHEYRNVFALASGRRQWGM